MDKAYREFDFDYSLLNENEKRVVEKLMQAAQLIGPLYLKQENNQYPGANLYPPDAKKEEIEEATKENPEILSRFTVVERDSSGNLVAIPYHQKYATELKPIAKLLEEAADISSNPNFSAYLKARAKAILTDDYEESIELWLSMPDSRVDLTIGPIERYLDKLFFVKTAYQATIHVREKILTEQISRIRDICFATKRSTFNGIHRVSPITKGVQVRVDYSPAFAGFKARNLATATHLPNELNYLKKYGSKLILFLPTLRLQFKKMHYPIFKAIFEEDFKKTYSKEILFRGRLFLSLLHEISHQLNKYENSEERLQDLFPVFDEVNAHITGIKNCRHLLLKSAISQRELEAIIVMYICFTFVYHFLAEEQPLRQSYAQGAALALNYWLATDALKERIGLSWPNFPKMFFAIENLSNLLVRILSTASREEAQRFFDRYYSLDVFKKFEERLKDIPTTL